MYEKVDRRGMSLPKISESIAGPSQQSSDFLRLYLKHKLQRIQGPAITFNIDDQKLAMLSATFGFVNDYILRPGVERADDHFNSGCNCDGPCDPSTCDCLDDEEDSDKKIVPYHRSATGQTLLHPSFLKRRSRIVECCDRCSCKGKCWNHVVQRGRQIRFEIFDTGARGFGMYPGHGLL